MIVCYYGIGDIVWVLEDELKVQRSWALEEDKSIEETLLALLPGDKLALLSFLRIKSEWCTRW